MYRSPRQTSLCQSHSRELANFVMDCRAVEVVAMDAVRVNLWVTEREEGAHVCVNAAVLSGRFHLYAYFGLNVGSLAPLSWPCLWSAHFRVWWLCCRDVVFSELLAIADHDTAGQASDHEWRGSRHMLHLRPAHCGVFHEQAELCNFFAGISKCELTCLCANGFFHF